MRRGLQDLVRPEGAVELPGELLRGPHLEEGETPALRDREEQEVRLRGESDDAGCLEWCRTARVAVALAPCRCAPVA